MALQSLRDEPNTQREYETIYVVRPDAPPERLQEVNRRIRDVIEKANGKLLRVENWGKRKLAYEIKKNNRGVYLYWRYLAPPSLITEVERNLRLLDEVIRYLTVKVDANIDPNARPSAVTDESFTAAGNTTPDEEDYYLGRTGGDEDEGGGERPIDEDDVDVYAGGVERPRYHGRGSSEDEGGSEAGAREHRGGAEAGEADKDDETKE